MLISLVDLYDMFVGLMSICRGPKGNDMFFFVFVVHSAWEMNIYLSLSS